MSVNERDLDNTEFYKEIENTLRKHLPDQIESEYAWMAQYLVFDQAHSLDEFWSRKEVTKFLIEIKYFEKKLNNTYFDLPILVSEALRFAASEKSGALEQAKMAGADKKDTYKNAFLDHPSRSALSSCDGAAILDVIAF
ncbi:hypothetical protein ROA7450_04127 [Roseovarius albus]|uniref:Uncharacterized protein n=2 Tax=Roseovarius albus TaxID=1247867 RepID=A0A1X7A947_9RHOB|nr:hypothetical protein ROA7450_04127 [Roseovarius albus]